MGNLAMGKAICLLERKDAIPFSYGVFDWHVDGSKSPEWYDFTLYLVHVNTTYGFPL